MGHGGCGYCNHAIDKQIAGKGGGFSLNMGQLIDWEDLKGIHGLATGNSKLAGKDILSWEKSPLPSDKGEQVLQPAQKNKTVKNRAEKSKTKFQCTENQKEEGYRKGLERAKSMKRLQNSGHKILVTKC